MGGLGSKPVIYKVYPYSFYIPGFFHGDLVGRLYIYFSNRLFRRAMLSFAALALMLIPIGFAQAGLIRAILSNIDMTQLSIYIALSNILSAAAMATAVYVVRMFARAGAEICSSIYPRITSPGLRIDCMISRWISGRPLLSSSLIAIAMIAGSSITSSMKMAYMLGMDPWRAFSALKSLVSSWAVDLYIALELTGYFLASISPSMSLRRAVILASISAVLIASAAYIEASIIHGIFQTIQP